ncbi:PA3371 family protein [Pseudomonas sp. MWU15-20650]|uniref:PA3371 family protein n=1 Tax=Pseudomonas sp. MWU15-20650 TaxID=2933107 RepID=UPI00200C5FD0|nr:PA3371 family protein [Pseudomonas sp. MWU15-20650]
MSKTAWLFLCLTLVAALLGLSTTSQDEQTTAFIASAVFGSLLMLALIAGRRIKFDPVLR